jgi:hypothetical protein
MHDDDRRDDRLAVRGCLWSGSGSRGNERASASRDHCVDVGRAAGGRATRFRNERRSHRWANDGAGSGGWIAERHVALRQR